MSKERIIAQGKVAIVFQSDGCDCINLTLSNMNMHFKRSDFLDYADYINAVAALHSDRSHIQVDTPFEGVTLFFLDTELQELGRLLSKSVSVLAIDNLSFIESFSLN